MSDLANSSVPKFASFRSKPIPPNQEDNKVKESKREVEEKPHHRRRDQSGNKNRHHHRRERSRSKEESWPQPRETQVPQGVEAINSENDAFVVDRKGDRLNLVYGSIHKYSVPPFHRYGAGRVLGSAPDLRIARDYTNDKSIILSSRDKNSSHGREKYIFSKVEREKPRLLKVRQEASPEGDADFQHDFVPLQSQRGKKRKRNGVPDEDASGSDHDERDYRSIHDNYRGRQQPDDVDLRYATDSDSSDSDGCRVVNFDVFNPQKTIELSRKVEKSPYDIRSWLDLINHQDTLIRGEDDRRRLTSAEIKSTAEIKIHLYEKALANIKSLKDREALLVGLMLEGAKIWDVKTQAKRWEQIAKENIDSFALWIRYLNFKQATLSIFKYEEVKDVYIQRLRTVSQLIANNEDESASTEPLYYQLIYLLLRMTLFMRESGYCELAVAIWQSLLELNFCGPPTQHSKTETLSLFEEFWESEVPRIGDENALGWSHYLQLHPSIDHSATRTDETTDILDSKSIFTSWAAAERLRYTGSRLPARTMDDVVEDDPFRVILFSDIKFCLIHLPPDMDNLHKCCMDAFLAFCRLPQQAVLNPERTLDWLDDSFVRNDLLEQDYGGLVGNWMTKADNDTTPVSNILPSPESLFWNSMLAPSASWQDRFQSNGPVSYQWVRNCISQLTQSWFKDAFAEYYLSFEYQNEPETIKKVSKGLIKQHPSNLRLYHSYALIEWSRSNKDIAASVFSAAVSISQSSFKGVPGVGAIMLWRSWIWACVEDSDNNSALRHILSIADGAPNPSIKPSPALILKARQYFCSNRDCLLSSNQAGHSILYSDCLALLEYLSGRSNIEPGSGTQGDIAAALLVYTSSCKVLHERNRSAANELLLQSAARLLFHHARTGPYRPALLREHLTRFIDLFPRNTMFLSLFSWNESRLRIDNRVRSLLIKKVLTPEHDTWTSRLFEIHYELQNGTIHSTKSAFERALSSDASKSSSGLWKSYILYCLQIPQFQKEAKDVWLRALRACPWVKELYILGFEKLGDLVGFEELRSIWRVMGEKELRIHVDLEDRFDEIAESAGVKKGQAHRRVDRQ